jgi:hypothetical protein
MKKFTLPTTREERMRAVLPILEFAHLKRLGEITEEITEDEPFERILNRIFADLVLDLLKPSLRRRRKKIPDEEVRQLIKQAMPEIERIYLAIKAVGFSGRTNAEEEHWQAAALKEYDANKEHFSLIERRHLEERKLYQFTGGQERRDFIGGVLKMIVKDRLDVDVGAQLLAQMARGTNRLN